MEQQEKLIKPALFAEQKILKAIIDGEWMAGHKLPPERELAQIIGVTRPTLREVLQRLSRDGWLTIKHGKPTIVNDYKNTGGLGVLKSLVKNEEFTSKSLIRDWLEFRVIVFPELAKRAVSTNSVEILDKLNHIPTVDTSSLEFAVYDWELQMLLVTYSRNAIAKMIYNDLTEIYSSRGESYFSDTEVKRVSLEYYKNLRGSIKNGSNEIDTIVKSCMQESLEIWQSSNL